MRGSTARAMRRTANQAVGGVVEPLNKVAMYTRGVEQRVEKLEDRAQEMAGDVSMLAAGLGGHVGRNLLGRLKWLLLGR